MSSKLFRRSLLALGLTSAIDIPLAHATERSWSYTYNAQGLIETADGPRNDVSDVTRYEYDDRNRLTSIINALGHIIRIEDFDGYGNPQKIIDANGAISLLLYTPQGWLASSTTEGSTTSIEYNAVGDITKLTRGDGSCLEYTWDDARRLVFIANNAGERISSDLNPMGKPIARRLHDNSGRVTHQREWVYDEIGRILEVVGAAGQIRKFKYDLNTNRIENNDPSNNKTQAAFDPLDRLVKSVDPLDGLSHYDYDAQDNVTKVVDPRGVITRYEYDAHGSLTHLDSPDSGKQTFLRDNAGNVIQKTDGRGITTIFTYDALNRLVNRQHPDKPELNIRFIYDETSDRRNGVGRLTSIEDSNGTMSFGYDEKGKLKDQTQTLKIGDIQYSDSIRFGYSQGGQVVRIDYPSQITIEYERNSTGQVNAVRWRPQGSEPLDLATNLSYLPFGPLASLDWASGHKLRREYNQDYQLTQQTVADWTTANEFDASGNLVSQQSSLLGKLAYKYDPLNRLSVETTASQQQTFTYDAAGNRITKTVSLKNAEHGNPGLITKYEYGVEDHKFKKIDDQNIHTDSAGNLTKLTGVSFDYDEQNRLVSAKSGVSSKASFRYNALGQRTHKITDSDTTTFIYGPKGELIGENKFDTSGMKVKSQYYIWLDGAPLAGILVSYDEQGAITNRTPFFIYSDHLNTPRIATNSSGQVIWQWTSDAFGVGKAEGSLALNLRFPGQYYDEETGLHYNYFRDYSPETGRYIQSDPIGLRGGLNGYGYVNGNPINAIDPKGLEATVIYVEGLIPHAALHIDDGSGQPFLYDPAGSYVGPSNLPRGSGDFFEGPDAALDSYINYWSSEGDNVHTFPLGTTREQDKILIDRAVDRASAAPFTCASSVSAILDNMCGVAPSSWPRTLGKNASQSNCK